MEILLQCSEKELREVSSGEKKMITREIKPTNAKRFVTLNERGECTGIIEYDTALLQCPQICSYIEIRIEETLLLKKEDERRINLPDKSNTKCESTKIAFLLGEIIGTLTPKDVDL